MDICARTRSVARAVGTGPAAPARCAARGAALPLRMAAVFALLVVPALPLAQPAAAQEQERAATNWTVPRTPTGHPDLQGNWTNATVTAIQRPEGRDPVYTWEEVAQIEGRVLASRTEAYADSDPDREAPPVGGTFTGDPRFDAASGGHRRLQRLFHRRRRARGDLQRRAQNLAGRRSA